MTGFVFGLFPSHKRVKNGLLATEIYFFLINLLSRQEQRSNAEKIGLLPILHTFMFNYTIYNISQPKTS